MKRPLQHIGAWLTEAATAGAPMLPLFIYLTGFLAHAGALIYVLPFVLFYSFNKTGVFIMEMFGPLNNPWGLARLGAWLVIVGAVLSLFVDVNLFFSDAGSILVGLGTAIFNPMYRSMKERLRTAKKWELGRIELVGFPLMIVFIASIMAFQAQLGVLVIAFYVVLSIIALLYLHSLPIPEEERKQPLFIYKEHHFAKGIPALLFFGLVLNVRLFKQTANVGDILFLFVATTAITLFVVLRGSYKEKQQFEYRGMFFMELFIFVLLFDVFELIGEGHITGLLLIFVFMFSGMYVAALFGKKILGHFTGNHVQAALIWLIMGASLIFAVPNDWVNAIGVGLVAFISRLGVMRTSTLYHKNEDWDLPTLYMESQKTNNIGIVVGQTILIGVLTVVSFLVFKDPNDMLYAYAFRIPQADLAHGFLITQWACLAIFWAQGIGLLIYDRFHDGKALSKKA